MNKLGYIMKKQSTFILATLFHIFNFLGFIFDNRIVEKLKLMPEKVLKLIQQASSVIKC